MSTRLKELLDNKFNNGDVIASVLEALRASGRAMTPDELVEAVRPLGVSTSKLFISVALEDLLGAGAIRRAAGGGEAVEAVETDPDDPEPAAPAAADVAVERPQGAAGAVLDFRKREGGGAGSRRPSRRGAAGAVSEAETASR